MKPQRAWAVVDTLLDKIPCGGFEHSFAIYPSRTVARERMNGWIFANDGTREKWGKEYPKVLPILLVDPSKYKVVEIKKKKQTKK